VEVKRGHGRRLGQVRQVEGLIQVAKYPFEHALHGLVVERACLGFHAVNLADAEYSRLIRLANLPRPASRSVFAELRRTSRSVTMSQTSATLVRMQTGGWGQRRRARVAALHLGLVACGGRTDDVDTTRALDSAEARCELATQSALNLERDLPGRWQLASGEFMAVQADLSSVWGTTVLTQDERHGSSTWSLTAEGLVTEVGLGPCLDGDSCGARFTRTGTLGLSADELVFYALRPKQVCAEGVLGVYEGIERFEQNDGVESELRVWSERSELLTLYVDGKWTAQLNTKDYGTTNDMGMRRWYEEPVVHEARDTGTYERTDGALRLKADEAPSDWLFVPDTEGPVELRLIGGALPKQGVDVYQRVEP
jgi:hypothetical protein